jgi:hypothetical protein
MKKNWFAVVSIVLDIVLLAAVIYLGGKLEKTERTLRSYIDNAERTIQNSVDNIEWNVENAIEKATKLVAEYTMEPVGIDAKNHTVEMKIDLQLQKWSADACVDVEVVSGANTYLKRLPIDATGSCSGNLIFPVEDSEEVKLAAIVTMNGVTTREELGGWDEIALMLPIMFASGGGAWPMYNDGMLVMDQYHAFLDGGGRWEITVEEPEFRFYINDRLEKEVPEDTQESGPQIEHHVHMEQQLVMPCEPGDTIRMTIACKDHLGLGYEFNIGIWRVPAEDGELEELPMEMETRAKLIWE